MTKRGFLKSMILAAVAPQVLVAAAEDRYRWKLPAKGSLQEQFEQFKREVPFKPANYYGKWQFTEYHRLPSGLWVKSGSGIDGVVACSEHDISLCNQWEAIHPKPHLEMCVPSADVEVIFHKRDS